MPRFTHARACIASQHPHPHTQPPSHPSRTRLPLAAQVYIHCHQGVSRSSAIAIAYLMWTNGWGYEPAYNYVRERRGVASPNAGFIARLMHLAKRLAEPTPTMPRLYRMAPAYAAPRSRSVDGTPTVANLDPRTAFVLHTPTAAFVWAGKRAHAEYQQAAVAWARQLEKFERAPAAQVLVAGEEPNEFWEALGGKAEARARASPSSPPPPPPPSPPSLPSLALLTSLAPSGTASHIRQPHPLLSLSPSPSPFPPPRPGAGCPQGGRVG